MQTFTQLYTRSAGDCGISIATTSEALMNIKQDINYALRKFKNASRRYYTKKKVLIDLVDGQQNYPFYPDMVRITTVRVSSGSLTLPVTIVDSEELWNRINLVPAMTVGIPTQCFIDGRNNLQLYPIPSTGVDNGLIITYESRMRDMSLDDITPTIDVTNNSAAVVANTGTPFTSSMVGMWLSVTNGSDGNWYQISGCADTTHITLDFAYQGPTATGVASIIGSAPDIPEDFHLALSDFACYRYYLKRKDKDTAASFKSLFDESLKDYKAIYAAKTTGLTQNDLTPYTYNLFNLPPQNVSA